MEEKTSRLSLDSSAQQTVLVNELRILLRSEGIEFHLLSSFRGYNLELYKGSYVLVKDNLGNIDLKYGNDSAFKDIDHINLIYIRLDGQYEKVPIANAELFLKNLKIILGTIKGRIIRLTHFSDEQINILITSNGGHGPEKSTLNEVLEKICTLENANIPVPGFPDYYNLLHFAAVSHFNEEEKRLIIKALVEKGAKLNAGYPPLHDACLSGDKDGIFALIKQGADVNGKNTLPGQIHILLNDTPLHVLVRRQSKENEEFVLSAATLLIMYGADVTAKNVNGESPDQNPCIQKAMKYAKENQEFPSLTKFAARLLFFSNTSKEELKSLVSEEHQKILVDTLTDFEEGRRDLSFGYHKIGKP